MCYLDIGAGVDLVDGVPWLPPGLSVQVVGLDKHTVVTDAAYPHVSLPIVVQLNTFTYV